MPRDSQLDAATAREAEQAAALRRARHLAIAGGMFLCSAVAALFALILAIGTLLGVAGGQYADDGLGLAFALIWDLSTVVCAVCTWRAAMRPAD